MTAFGELIVYFIYFFLGAGTIVFLVLTFKTRKSFKPWALMGVILFCLLLFRYNSYLKDSYKKKQLDQVGTYYLTNYPNCDSCILVLKEDMTYEIKSKSKTVERSNWHYESGGDYFITYLDNDRHQLGAGDYSYNHYKLKYSGRSN